MKRRHLLITLLAALPLSLIAKPVTWKFDMRTDKGFKVNSGEARFGKHYKMKGVTLNILDIKISGSDTENDLAVFEQTGLTPKVARPCISILFRTSGFTWWRANTCFKWAMINLK